MAFISNLKLTALLAAAMVFAIVRPALPHHSHAMFDHEKEVTIDGTVAEWVFRNPHVYLYVETKMDNGETVKYSVEMSNITNMIRAGFGANTFKAGDKVSVKLNPLRDGRPGGNYINATTADGKTFGRV
jgi:hypothetical protein